MSVILFGGVCLQGCLMPQILTSSGGYCSVRYASYWNAFLFPYYFCLMHPLVCLSFHSLLTFSRLHEVYSSQVTNSSLRIARNLLRVYSARFGRFVSDSAMFRSYYMRHHCHCTLSPVCSNTQLFPSNYEQLKDFELVTVQ